MALRIRSTMKTFRGHNITGVLAMFLLLIIANISLQTIYSGVAFYPFTALSQPGYRSSLYGILAYPVVTHQNQSWIWLNHFLQSLPQTKFWQAPSENVHWKTDPIQPAHDFVVHSVRFQDIQTGPVESAYLEKFHGKGTADYTTVIPVYDCGLDHCQNVTTGSFLVREDSLPAIQGHLVIVHARQTDIYDLQRVLTSLPVETETLLLIITIRASRSTRKEWEDDEITPLYDLLHRLFFDLNWIPTASAQLNCTPTELLKGCQFWISWRVYSPKEILRYIPPAGDGSPEMEQQRLSAFLNTPNENACRVKQGLSGQPVLGAVIDGCYWVCLDHLRIAASRKNCLVYSFGIRTDWSFDDAMHHLGCEVHSFDPSTGLISHRRAARHWFHNLGISTNTSAADPKWRMATFKDIQQRLGHVGRRIDVLKMDIEGAEWSFLASVLHDPAFSLVGQFIFEMHQWEQTRRRGWAENIRQKTMVLHNIEKRGFVMFNSKVFSIFTSLRSIDYQQLLPLSRSSFFYELSFINPAF
ncbi:hypothetical protein BV898_10917 [Hypsibius exemplaris]|uniref:Methyltransferase domain-containing protein n=1 Tax=Hypsibius exemplaris TaxID=2072580 RepID=A0A1W0WI46_HYPEX|nr:hypothetical protein BV898_10917 [Hypsibius exemplaris]